MIKTVNIRIIADTEQDANDAIDELRASVGSARLIMNKTKEGRRGEWLAYGAFQFDPTLPTTIQGATQAATGPTTRWVKP